MCGDTQKVQNQSLNNGGGQQFIRTYQPLMGGSNF